MNKQTAEQADSTEHRHYVCKRCAHVEHTIGGAQAHLWEAHSRGTGWYVTSLTPLHHTKDVIDPAPYKVHRGVPQGGE